MPLSWDTLHLLRAHMIVQSEDSILSNVLKKNVMAERERHGRQPDTAMIITDAKSIRNQNNEQRTAIVNELGKFAPLYENFAKLIKEKIR